LRNPIVLALVACTAIGCAATPEGKPPAACAPPPTELVVKDITPGTGQAVRFRSAVTVGYTGWVYDGCKADFKGAEFDSSRDRQVPFGFMVGAGRVIKGWDEGLIGMKEKGKRLLIIPASKAYGEREMAGGKIPANSTLVFEIDLAQIVYQPGEAEKK
jgi:FKBP-type peptidyl-prolyl cis-trans isomerase FkpA